MSEPTEGIVAEYAELHERLRRLVRDIEPAALDRPPAEGENTIAVLIAHILGSELGWLSRAADRAHQRDREAEFRTRGRTSEDLLATIDTTDLAMSELVEAAVRAGLETIRDAGSGRAWTVARTIAFSVSHTAEHVGHAELTRNLVAPRTSA